MRHGIYGRKLNRTSAHRKSMFSNMVVSLLRHEQIQTTLPKAKDLRKYVDRIITLGKKGSLHARRKALSIVREKTILSKIFKDFSQRYKTRHGGYTRIIKTGFRYGDNAPIAIIEMMDRNWDAKSTKQ